MRFVQFVHNSCREQISAEYAMDEQASARQKKQIGSA